MPVTEQASQEAVAMTFPIRGRPTASCRCAKWLVLGVLVRVLFAIVHLLLERLGLLLVRKGQPC